MLYQEADLYLMPSLFEPCGISQMLAMRNGQPCLVHKTGGLADTVKHMKTGFVFKGDSFQEKLQDFRKVFSETIDLFVSDKKKWKQISENARKQRFTWEKSVDDYYEKLYS